MTLTRRAAVDLLSDLRRGALSAAELMEGTLARIGAVNGAVNAIVALRGEDALMAEARAADRAATRGPSSSRPSSATTSPR